MTIVGNTDMLNIFKKIPIFKLNLGFSIMDMKQEKFSIKDAFILKYLNMTGKQIMTYGTIGKLIFYQDFTLPRNEFFIFNDETIYGLVYTAEDSKMTPENYLVSIIQEITEKEEIKDNVDKVDKFDTKPDIKLPAEQYIEQMIKKRKNES